MLRSTAQAMHEAEVIGRYDDVRGKLIAGEGGERPKQLEHRDLDALKLMFRR